VTEINLGYVARPAFEPFHLRKQRFSCLVCHRRAGKTVACIHDLVDAALRCQKVRPRFAYVAPYRSQAKTVAWDYLCAAVEPLRGMGVEINQAELRVDLPGGSQVRLYGSDNPDALRGIYLDGCVLDEYGDQDPRTWSEVISPALADRQGWAVFIGTPKGQNDFYDVWERSQKDPKWFSLMLKASDSGILPPDELEAQRSTKSAEEYAQEFECSFDAAVKGAYYGKLMEQAELDKRICGVPYDPSAQVWTAWDLGIRDATAIWFAQVVGKEVHIIDYYEATGADLGHYVRELNSRSYVYAGHIVPHDAQAKELGTGKSRLEVLESLGLRQLRIAPMHRVEDGINGVRTLIPRCWFDATKCATGVKYLKLYRSDWDEKLKVLRPTPRHDYTSHAADAFRYLAMTLDGVRQTAFNRRIEMPVQGFV
jgi:phage terminase large subunit